MPRIVSGAEKSLAIKLMLDGLGQREICRRIGLSRPYLRKLAKDINFQFARNGVEIVGQLCMCVNCSTMFRRPKSKVKNVKNTFCSEDCKKAWHKGVNHPGWRTGESSKSFSEWIKNQSAYGEWREAVLRRDGHKCIITGRTDNLDVHHILPKMETLHPEKALDIDNGITVNTEVHQKMHELIGLGIPFNECVDRVKELYAVQESNKG